MITKSQVIGNLFARSSTNALAENNTERNTTNTSYQLVKSFKIAGGLYPTSRVTLSYEQKTTTAITGYSKLMLNSTELDEQTCETSTYETKTYDLTGNQLKKGDQIHLYIKHSSGAGTHYVKNFKILGQVSPAINILDQAG